MKLRTLFLVILKVIGLLLIKPVLDLVSQLINTVLFSLAFDSSSIGRPLISCILLLVLYLAMAYQFLFKTTFLLEKLQLTSWFEEEELHVPVPTITIITIAVIILGGWMIARELPTVILDVSSVFGCFGTPIKSLAVNATAVTTSLLNLSIGFAMIKKHKQIAGFIERQTRS